MAKRTKKSVASVSTPAPATAADAVSQTVVLPSAAVVTAEAGKKFWWFSLAIASLWKAAREAPEPQKPTDFLLEKWGAIRTALEAAGLVVDNPSDVLLHVSRDNWWANSLFNVRGSEITEPKVDGLALWQLAQGHYVAIWEQVSKALAKAKIPATSDSPAYIAMFSGDAAGNKVPAWGTKKSAAAVDGQPGALARKPATTEQEQRAAAGEPGKAAAPPVTAPAPGPLARKKAAAATPPAPPAPPAPSKRSRKAAVAA